ncbi:MAG: hypothetical protein V4695_08900 [Pseudomonadota bacterium]
MTGIADFARRVFYRSNAADQDQEKQPSAVSVSTLAEGSHLLTDAIHYRLDNRQPHGTPRAKINRLKEYIHAKLRPGQKVSEYTRATGFSAIKSRDGDLFELTAANGQRLKRTRQETELHVLLQSQLQHNGAIGTDTGDAITLEINRHPGRRAHAPTPSRKTAAPPATLATLPGSASARSANTPARPVNQASYNSSSQPVAPEPRPNVPQPAPMPSAAMPAPAPTPASAPAADAAATNPQFRPPEDMENASGTKSKIYFSQTVDMRELDNVFSHSHQRKSISPVGNNCWWRSTFAAIIMQHGTTPQRLQAAFENLQLGSDYEIDIQNVLAMAMGNGNKGMTEIFTNLTHAKLSHDLEQESRLKMPGEEVQYDARENSLETAGEASCRRLTKAILLKKGNDADEVEQCVNGNAPGELHLVTSLTEALDANLIIFNQPWTRNEMPPRWSVDESTLTICARPGSALENLEHDPDKQSCTKAILRETDVYPVLTIRATHYDLMVTSTNIAQAHYPIL